jgi:hypothetical protein
VKRGEVGELLCRICGIGSSGHRRPCRRWWSSPDPLFDSGGSGRSII